MCLCFTTLERSNVPSRIPLFYDFYGMQSSELNIAWIYLFRLLLLVQTIPSFNDLSILYFSHFPAGLYHHDNLSVIILSVASLAILRNN